MHKPFAITVCVLTMSISLACAFSGADPEQLSDAHPVEHPLPRYIPRFDREMPIVVIIGENRFTELTDFFIPYGVLTASKIARVFALGTRDGPIQMFPALRIEPHGTIENFDIQFPLGADYVIVPAVHYSEDARLLAWIKAQADKGATIVGVCDGVRVLANAGLLEGRRAVGHWYSFDGLEEKFRRTQWIRNRRYVGDGNVVTTTGVTASIPVSVALVEAIADRRVAAKVAREMGVKTWTARHESHRFQLGVRDIMTGLGNWASFWSHEEIAIPIAEGVDEVALALMADSFSRTYRSRTYSTSHSSHPVTTRRGLTILPDRIEGDGVISDRMLNVIDGIAPIVALDQSLEAIEKIFGIATANIVALQLEYPWR